MLGGCPGREDSMLEEALNTSLENPKGEVSKLVEGKTPSLLYDDSYTDRKWSVEENLNIVEAHIKKGGIFFFAKEKIQMQSVG